MTQNSNSYSLTGTVHKLFPSEKKTDTFEIRNIVVKVTEPRRDGSGVFENYIQIQYTNKSIERTMSLEVGDVIETGFSLSGRMWQPKDGGEKCITSINGFNVNIMQKAGTPVADAATVSAGSDLPMDDGLPF